MIDDMPMLHCDERRSKSKLASRVILATPDEEIEKWGWIIGGKFVKRHMIMNELQIEWQRSLQRIVARQ